MTDEVLALRVELEELRAAVQDLRTPPPPQVTPNWGERTCQTCGDLADVIDLSRPDDWPAELHWNGEGYCRKHAAREGIEERAHLLRPGPKRKAAS